MSTGATQFAQVEQMVLRGVGFRWGCPSYFSGDGQDSFASVLVTGSPFVRITESRQEKFKGFCRKVAYRVLEFCEQSGRLPPGTCKRVRPVATARPVVIADEEKQARTFLSLYEKNCADPVEFIRKRGGDPKIVAANIAAWQKKFAPPQGGGGTQPGGGPVAAPPGSAGGDGSSPNVEENGQRQSAGVPRPIERLLTGSKATGSLAESTADQQLHEPPFPGAVLMGDPPRWHNPHTQEEAGKNQHADNAVRLLHPSKLPSELKKEYTQHLIEVLTKMPEGSRKVLHEALGYDHGGAKVVFHPDLKALTKAIRAEKVRVGRKEEVGGCVIFKKQTFGGVQLHLDGAGAGRSAQGNYAHESGHLISLAFAQRLPKDGGGAELASHDDWKKVWQAEISVKRPKKQLGISRRAEVDAHEGIAEFYRMLHENGSDYARANFPKCVKFLESKGLLS